MHQTPHDPRIGLVLIGFSPPERLGALARHLHWPGLVLSDEPRRAYAALGFTRAPLWRVYSPATLRTYGRAARRGQKLPRPVEDTRQMGGDAVMVNGTVCTLWRPRSPDDRPPAATVLINAAELLAREAHD